MILTPEMSFMLVMEPFYYMQLYSCWNLLPQKNDRKKNLLNISLIFVGLIVIYNFVLFTKGFTFTFNSTILILTIPSFIMYYKISKFHDSRLVFAYFFSDSILSIFNYFAYALCITFFKDLTISYVIIRNLTMLLFTILFNKLYIPKIRDFLNTKDVNWIILTLITVAAAFYIYYEIPIKGNLLERSDELFSITFTFVSLCIVFLTLLWTLAKIREKEIENLELIKKENALDLMRIQIKQVDSTYEQISETYEKLRMIKHDITKELTIIESLCQEGDIKKIKDYTSSIIKKIPEKDFVKYSNNHMIDSILNHYKQKVEKENIKYDFTVLIKNFENNRASDICIILANALDNAIEATIKTEEKFINLNIIQKEKSLLISVQNSYEPNSLKKNEDKLISSKKDVENHGLGLKIIENIAHSYSGNMLYTTDNNIFRIDVWLYL